MIKDRDIIRNGAAYRYIYIFLLDFILLLVIISNNNIRKAKTEKSRAIRNLQREEHLVEVLYVEIVRKPFLSCNTEISMCYRIPALKVRIC